MRYRLTFGACGRPGPFKSLPELAKTPLHVACVGVNRYDQRRSGASGTMVGC